MTTQTVQLMQLSQQYEKLTGQIQNQITLNTELATKFGSVERATNRMSLAWKSSPIVQFKDRMVAYGASVNKIIDTSVRWATMSEKEAEERRKSLPLLSKVIVKLLMMNKTTELGNKLLAKKDTHLMRIMVKFLSLFSIILIFVAGLSILAVAIEGSETPLLGMTENMGILHSAVEGLVMVIHGEGEGGLTGAINVLIATLMVGAVAWLAFGAPLAIVVATVMGVVGTFKLVEKGTGSLVTSILAALAVGVVGLGVFLATINVMLWSTVATVMLPIAVVVGGIAAIWAAFTGNAPAWIGAVGAFAIALVAALFLPLYGIPVAIGAIVVGVIFLIVQFWDEIVGFVTIAINWIKGLGLRAVIAIGVATAFILGLPAAVTALLLIAIIKNWDSIMAFFRTVGAWFASRPAAIEGFFSKVGNAITTWVTKKVTWVGQKVSAFVKLFTDAPGNAKDKFLSGLGQIGLGLAKWYNDSIAGFIDFTVPDIIPGIGGTTIKFPPTIPLPTYMAEGGIVTRATNAVIGEAGPEAVIPLDDAGGFGLGQTINVNIDVSGVTDRSDKRALAREISDILAEEMRRSGGNMVRGRF